MLVEKKSSADESEVRKSVRSDNTSSRLLESGAQCENNIDNAESLEITLCEINQVTNTSTSFLINGIKRGSNVIGSSPSSSNATFLEPMTAITSVDNISNFPETKSISLKVPGEDDDNESIISDYSELGDAFKEHLTTSFSEGELKLIGKHELGSLDVFHSTVTTDVPETKTPILGDDARLEDEEETEESYAKRMKKINYLSLAQEFAELKKMDANALPFGLTHDATFADASDEDERPVSTLAVSEEDDTEEVNSTCDDVNSYTESAQPTPMDISQENDSLSCPESDSQLATRPPDLPVDETLEGDLVLKDLEALTIDVVEAWRVVAPERDNVDPAETTLLETSIEPSMALTTDSETNVDSPGSENGAFEVYSVETFAPPAMTTMDWSSWERKLEEAKGKAEEEAKKKSSSINDREEIRRRLAMGDADDDVGDFYCGDRASRRPNLATRLKSNMTLQICFMNEDSETIEIDPSTTGDGEGESEEVNVLDSTLTSAQPLNEEVHRRKSEPRVDEASALDKMGMKNSKSVGHFLHCLLPGSKQPQLKVEAPELDEDFESRQNRLRTEAQKALAQAQPMAHMQIAIEKMQRKKSPIEEIMSFHGINLGDPEQKLTREVLERDMNLAQLQVIFNDLRTQIDNYSQELVRLLEERDDLHMEQDSMLVDIDDLTRRLKELAEKNKKIQSKSEAGLGRKTKKTPLKQFNEWLHRK